jgi:hypothetical protein
LDRHGTEEKQHHSVTRLSHQMLVTSVGRSRGTRMFWDSRLSAAHKGLRRFSPGRFPWFLAAGRAFCQTAPVTYRQVRYVTHQGVARAGTYRKVTHKVIPSYPIFSSGHCSNILGDRKAEQMPVKELT